MKKKLKIKYYYSGDPSIQSWIDLYIMKELTNMYSTQQTCAIYKSKIVIGWSSSERRSTRPY